MPERATGMGSAIEAGVIRKISWRILPFVALLYFVSFLDRVNVGFAALSMNKAIGLTPAMFGLGGGIFFLGYFLFEVPSNLILQRVGARLWIARVMVTWGLVSAGCAFVTGPHSFYALRLLLGIAEAGFFPGIIYYLTLWFPRRYRASAAGAFLAAAPLSTAIGSPISGALMAMRPYAGLSNWQWLYLIEAAPAIVLGFVVLKALTDTPDAARWLDEDEKKWLIETLRLEGAERDAREEHAGSVLRALRDPRVLAFSFIYMGTSAGLYALGLWSPLVLQQIGYSPVMVGWINALGGAVAVGALMLWAWQSDRLNERRWHVAGASMVAALGFTLAGHGGTAALVIGALMLANIGISAVKAPLWAMPTMFLSGAGAAAGIALINSIGNLGGFAGPFVIGWLKGKTGNYSGGLDFVAATLVVSAVGALMVARGGSEQPSN